MSGDDGQDPMTPSERRIGVRHFACFPAHVEKPDGAKRTAMIHDLSISGALLVVRTRLNVDDRVWLQLYVNGDPDSPTRATPARVVRIEPLEPKAVGPWTHRVGVQFDEPLTDFQDEIKALEARQRALGLVP
jgi:PilZ domain